MWIIIAIIAIAVIYMTIKTASISGSATAVKTAADSAGQAARSYGGMVGGC